MPSIVGVFFGLPSLGLLFIKDMAGTGFFLSIIAGAFVGFAFLTRKLVEMGFTSKRVITKSGILSRRTLELLLTKVESIGIEEGLLGRMLGYGTAIVRGTGGTPEPVKNIASPLEFRRQAQQQIEHRTPEKVSA